MGLIRAYIALQRLIYSANLEAEASSLHVAAWQAQG